MSALPFGKALFVLCEKETMFDYPLKRLFQFAYSIKRNMVNSFKAIML